MKDSVNSQQSSSESTDNSVNDSNKTNGHVCYVQFCSLCRSFHKRDEQCYVQPIVPKNKQNYLLVFYKCKIKFLSLDCIRF